MNFTNTNFAQESFDLYVKYLTTPRKNFEDKITLPTKESIVKEFLKQHTSHYSPLIEQQLQKGGRILFWSDQHFQHNNIIKYSNRPFNDTIEMKDFMISHYYKKVKEDDLVIWVGDVVMGNPKNCDFLYRLPGKKILILGNHDVDRDKKYSTYHIFDEISIVSSFQIPVGNSICNLIISHYPIPQDLLPDNTLNIHGHIHTYDAEFKNINVSVEKTNYQPVDIFPIILDKFESIKK